MTHSPDFVAESRLDCMAPVGCVFYFVARADFWYARDHYGER